MASMTTTVLSGLLVGALAMVAGGGKVLASTDAPTVAATAMTAPEYGPLPAKQAREIAAVSPKTLAAIGSGKRGKSRNQPPGLARTTTLMKGGKPELAYILAEWCPFCAGESWSVAVALSRFGRLDGLKTVSSSSTDVPASLRTISFRYAHFHSRYLAFDPIVNEDARHRPAESVPRKVRAVWTRYIAGYPFLDFGGRAILDASSFSPAVLATLSRGRIAADLGRRSTAVARAVDGSANQITAAICLMTHDKPRGVCDAKFIAKIQRSLPVARRP